MTTSSLPPALICKICKPKTTFGELLELLQTCRLQYSAFQNQIAEAERQGTSGALDVPSPLSSWIGARVMGQDLSQAEEIERLESDLSLVRQATDATGASVVVHDVVPSESFMLEISIPDDADLGFQAAELDPSLLAEPDWRAEFSRLEICLSRFPATVVEKVGWLTDSMWWVKLAIDPDSPDAWEVVRVLGDILNGRSELDDPPVVFMPVSIASGISSIKPRLAWVIWCEQEGFLPDDCATVINSLMPE